MNIILRLLLSIALSVGAFSPVQAFGDDEYRAKVSSHSPDMRSRIYGDIELMTSNDQELNIYNGILKKKRLFAKFPFRYEPQITWHGNDLVELTVGTGSPGRFSIFYDLKEDVFSEPMWFVLAFDETRRLAVLGEDRLRVVKVFENKEILEIKRNDLPVTAITFLIIEEARFDARGNLHLQYQNSTGEISIAVIPSSEIMDKTANKALPSRRRR